MKCNYVTSTANNKNDLLFQAPKFHAPHVFRVDSAIFGFKRNSLSRFVGHSQCREFESESSLTEKRKAENFYYACKTFAYSFRFGPWRSDNVMYPNIQRVSEFWQKPHARQILIIRLCCARGAPRTAEHVLHKEVNFACTHKAWMKNNFAKQTTKIFTDLLPNVQSVTK